MRESKRRLRVTSDRNRIRSQTLEMAQKKPRTRANARTPKKAASYGKVFDFLRLLWALDHGLQTTSKRMNARYGVTALQRMIVRVVGRSPGTSAGEVAETLHVHPSTLTGALDRLVRAGMVVRETDPVDARRARLTLSPRGRVIDQIRTATVEAAVRKVLAGTEGEKVDAAAEVLGRIVKLLEAIE